MANIILRNATAFREIATPEDGITASAVDGVRSLVQRILSGDVSPRHAHRFKEAIETADGITHALTRIVADVHGMVTGAAHCALVVAECGAGIDAYATTAAKNAEARAEIEARASHLPEVVEQEMEVRGLVAQVQAAELRQRLAAFQPAAAAAPLPAQRSTRLLAVPSAPQAPTTAAPRRIDSDDAMLARLASEAAAILREVQSGLVHADAGHPFHAFAGCLYLRAKLDGEPSRAAAAHAQEELVAHMREDYDFTTGERKAFRREYDLLKKQLDANADTRQGAAFLAMMKRVGAASAPSNGGGVQ